MVKHSIQGDECIFSVRVVPRASRTEIVGEYDGALRVRIAAPPVDDAANEELIRILARTFKVSRSAVCIVKGRSAKLKQVRIAGVRPDFLASLDQLA